MRKQNYSSLLFSIFAQSRFDVADADFRLKKENFFVHLYSLFKANKLTYPDMQPGRHCWQAELDPESIGFPEF